jgi:hypothetical protein
MHVAGHRDRVMKKAAGRRDVVTLADLSPRQDIKGGSQQRVFGAGSPGAFDDNASRRMAMKTTKVLKDLPPKSTSAVKGGKRVD